MKKGNVFILLTALAYSTQEIANKMLVKEGLDSFQITFFIFLIGAILLTPLAIKDIKDKNLKLGINDLGYFSLNAALCIPISMALLSFAGKYTLASTSAVIFSSNALFTVPFAYLILKEKINKKILTSLIIGMIGVIIIFNPVKIINGGGTSDLLGITLALGSAAAWSLFTVISKIRIHRYGGYIFNCIVFYVGALMVLLILLVTGRPIIKGIDGHAVLVLGYMGLFVKAIGYICYLGAIRLTSAVTASLVFLIKPALATILAVMVLGDKLKVNVVIGIVFIIVSSYIAFKSKRAYEAVVLD
ncbi:DMT family transporter [Clostridium estertheticum]|uniref:EamA family transporter n=1 Tax=Clostridium estertheticum TaxID=238834 RepID=A0A5N7J1Z0_9CLOT|nr:EamA family transporter [Clostridium estertheticum]MBU3170974.1 DMT family transporter [Clostridium estertheticum]MBU3184382.1 DMT family transporter [Clostridium estertheticum]MCB2342068.1 DMT family transporter [Clostridium estertheticum]MPQ32094.1 EamA family transporter [Clostridium estertheticum]MPQ62754.1 EamA family transporter [Clostridium estertheticum]